MINIRLFQWFYQGQGVKNSIKIVIREQYSCRKRNVHMKEIVMQGLHIRLYRASD